jgi:hypothetical protein
MADPFNPVLPLRIAASVTHLSSSEPNWTLLDPGIDSARKYVAHVRFEQPFIQTPVVHTGLAGFDIGNGDAARVKLRATAVHPDGFDVEVETWFGTRIWSVDVSWLAIGH